MRSSASSWHMKAVLVLIVLSFISFYGWSAGKGLILSSKAASVNGDSISINDLSERTRNMIAQYRSMGLLKDDVPEGIEAMLQGNVLQGMIEQKLKGQQAQKLGLVASDNAVRELIRTQFTSPEGNFDFALYKKIITLRLHKSPAAYEQDQADAQVVQTFDNLFTTTAYSTQEELKDAYRGRNQKVNLEFVEITPEMIRKKAPAPASPSEAEIEKFYKEHEAQYKTPEKRQLEIAWINLKDLVTSSDEDLKATLEQVVKDEKGISGDRFRASHILIRTTETDSADKLKLAEDIYRRVTHGQSFEAVAQSESEDGSRTQGGDLGYFGKGAMVKEFEAAAQTLKPNEISKPIKSQFGFHVIKLVDRIPAGEPSVSRLKAELIYKFKQKAMTDKTTEDKLSILAQKTLNEIREKVKKGETFQAASSGSKAHFTKTNFVGSGDHILGVADDSQLIRLSETLTTRTLSDPTRGYSSPNYYLVQVGAIHSSSLPPLASMKSKVQSDIQKEALGKISQTWVQGLLRKWIDSKKPLNALAKQEGLKTQETGEFAKAANNQIPKLGTNEKAMEQAFELSTQSPFISEPVEIKQKTYIVALKNKIEPDWKKFEKDVADLRNLASQEEGKERLNLWMESSRKQAKIKNYLEKPTVPAKG